MAEGGWASTSLCQLQKASCLAEEPLVPYCRQGPSPTPACGPHTHTCEQNENRPPSPDRRGQAWCLPSVISIRILLPLTHLHVSHRPGRAPVVLFSHPTVGPWLHELFSSWNQKNHFGSPSCQTPSASDPGPSPTFPHATEGVLVGLVRTHSAHHLWATHAWLVALRVGSHGVPS